MNINENVVIEMALSDSYIWQSFNNHAAITSIIINGIKNSKVITEDFIDEQIMQIERTHISPLSDKVLEAYRNGDIMLLQAKDGKIPQSLPFFVTKLQGKVKGIIFINNYGTISKTTVDGKKHLNISMKDLYVLMEGAFVAHNCAVYPGKLNRSMGLMKICCAIYTNMWMRLLNKEYSLGNDLDLYDSVTFCIGKFFLERVWQATNSEVINSYATSNIRTTVNRGINLATLSNILEQYDNAEIKTLDNLIEFLRNYSPRLKGMNYRYILQCYITMYKAPAIFSVEVLPYFLFAVQSSMIGSFITNQPIIMDVCKTVKGSNNFYSELTKVII